MPRRLIIAALAASVVISCSGDEARHAGRLVSVGSHSLHAVVVGEGSPAVVIDSGLGALSDEYSALQARIASSTTVVAYDRAGYGLSESGPLPRDSRRESNELRSLLTGLGIPPPYVLVGHSLGGLNAEVYAHLYPEEVVGLILLDPPPLSFLLGLEYAQFRPMADEMTEEWQDAADRGRHAADEEERTRATFFDMIASEHREAFASSAELAASIESFGDTPLVVIASGVPNPLFGEEAQAYQQYWATQSQSLSTKSSRGQFILEESSTHRLHEDAVDMVAARVLSMVESLKKQE